MRALLAVLITVVWAASTAAAAGELAARLLRHWRLVDDDRDLPDAGLDLLRRPDRL